MSFHKKSQNCERQLHKYYDNFRMTSQWNTIVEYGKCLIKTIQLCVFSSIQNRKKISPNDLYSTMCK